MEVARWLLGEEDHFSREDDFGLVGQLTFPANRFIDSVNLLIKAEDWLKKTHDYLVSDVSWRMLRMLFGWLKETRLFIILNRLL